MGTDQVITLGRAMLIEVAILVAPLLLITVAVSFRREYCAGAHLVAGPDFVCSAAAPRNGRGLVCADAVDVAAP